MERPSQIGDASHGGPSSSRPGSHPSPVWPSDYSLSNSIHQLFLRLPPEKINQLGEAIARAAREHDLLYEEADGSVRLIPILMRPRLLDRRQVEYFHRVGRHMNRAFARLGRLLLEKPALRSRFSFSDAEWSWVDRYLRAAVSSDREAEPEQGALMLRWDANTTFSGRRWRGQFHFFETNGVGAGGLWYGPAVEEVISRLIVPELARLDAQLVLRPSHDARDLLRLQLERHARALGLAIPRVALVIEGRISGGPVEFARLATFLRQHGLDASICDARELELSGGIVRGPHGPVDLVYRDTQLSELVRYEQSGEPVDAVRQLFAENRVVSSIIGELDHKSCLEIFTDPALVDLFPAAEQRVFRRHVLWTRLLAPRRTPGPDGKPVDLLPHVAANRGRYVIKPNRDFGGRGVTIGSKTDPATWESLIELAAREPGRLVVQQRAVVSRKRFPVVNERGQIAEASLHVVCSFFLTCDGISLIGRAGANPVVNVAQRGGMTALLICPNRPGSRG